MTVCGWEIEVEGCSVYSAMPEAKRARIDEMAADFLWNWTGRTYGLCPIVVRPCREDCLGGGSTFWGNSWGWNSLLYKGRSYSIGCGRCGGDECSCSHVESLRLPGPINAIIEIIVDGVTLPPSAYRVDNERFLVRTDGKPWPTCQDLNLPPGEPGTWSVEYLRGVPVPEGGKTAAALLACEFAKALAHDQTCSLPKRIQSITRQGVSVTVLDDFENMQKSGQTGIWLIDSWVASVMKPPRVSTVRSPDIRSNKVRWTGSRSGSALPGSGNLPPEDGGGA